MKELIDRKALLAEYDRVHIGEPGKARKLIEDAPEAVVLCKDCKHWYEPEETCLKIYSDGAVSAYAWQFRKPDDFCSYGERKDDGKE